MKTAAFLTLIACALVVSPVIAQDIYRVVDEDGNVTYTDQKPDDHAEVVELPELNVLGDDTEAGAIEPEPEETEPAEPMDFHIDSPQADATIESNQVDVSMSSNVEIPPTAQIVLYLNGQAQEPVQSTEVTLDGIGPGLYQLRAELQTPAGRLLAETDSVSFEVVGGDDPDGP
ncbi:DUF4124 domain-containing protein [Wenzhouxiangella sp. AB-CW3]|uniref:DUF4124 domain-containing protein n=1 Tax=Wenzhouxiangella sp. AB-CW3 TaxID=2771012 RepID=UPI00168A5A4F|nr:DUF4124 domain-containing protein [Wenzhouxiangella sp. AB-CW3]QOC22276.1 DUF4124 domain-containing protein [Wenzhouxiangella sp. AB-CW3]